MVFNSILSANCVDPVPNVSMNRPEPPIKREEQYETISPYLYTSLTPCTYQLSSQSYDSCSTYPDEPCQDNLQYCTYNNLSHLWQSSNLCNQYLSNPLHNTHCSMMPSPNPRQTTLRSSSSFSLVEENHISSLDRHQDNNYPLISSYTSLADDVTAENVTIDEETWNFLSELCKSEPYLCFENIMTLLIERFPYKKHVTSLAFVNLLKSQMYNIRGRENVPYGEDVISTVVRMHQMNSKMSIDDIGMELQIIYPNNSLLDASGIYSIIKANILLKKTGATERELTKFIEKLVKQNQKMELEEICMKVRNRFPGRKIVSATMIKRISHDIKGRLEKQSLDVIDLQVRKFVKKICYDFKETSEG